MIVLILKFDQKLQFVHIMHKFAILESLNIISLAFCIIKHFYTRILRPKLKAINRYKKKKNCLKK
ncbi:hypothetical protein BpHYR1_011157 [Brachionus plicatilis]|uniref:Uncharacterized protein n=1 Tax=Brachionus plicatilis TaxID=10195 RepID=A0A3M7S8S9_BRAPC|nr:hypothetical protein BpHYR1_011157 [Brachionus plicatilis]